MNDREALLRAVIDDPEDDAPRLVYADFLEETGGPADVARARFIRTQIELESTPEDDPRWEPLHTLERQLNGEYWRVWCRELPNLPGVDWWTDRFRRGFAESVWLNGAEDWGTRIEQCVAAAPIRQLSVYRLSESNAEMLAASPHVKWVTDLVFREGGGQRLDPAALRALFHSEFGRRLRQIQFQDCPYGDEIAQTVAELPPSGQLRSLSFRLCGLGASGAEFLASARLPNLTELNLGGNRIGEAGLRSLLAADGWPCLASVCLAFNQLGDAVGTLAVAPRRIEPARLNLSSNDIGDAGLRKLAEADPWPRLRFLGLRDERLPKTPFRALLHSAWASGLSRLDLSEASVGETGGKILGAAKLPNLTRLDLDQAGVGNQAAKALAAAKGLPRLRVLSVKGNKIGRAELRALLNRFGEGLWYDW